MSAALIENCKISSINPHAWLSETLTKLANGHPAIGVGDLKIHRATAVHYDQLVSSSLNMVPLATASYWLKFASSV